MNSPQPVTRRMRMTLGAQLGGVIALMLLLAVGVATWLTMDPFVQETRSMALETHLDLSSAIASQTRSRLQVLAERAKQVGLALMDGNAQGARALAQAVFEGEPDLLMVHLVEVDDGGAFRLRARELSPRWMSSEDPQGQMARALILGNTEALRVALHGEVHVRWVRHPSSEPMLRMTFPLAEGGESRGILLDALLRQSAIRNLLPEREGFRALLIDQMGFLIAATPDFKEKPGADLAARAGVRQFLEGKVDRGQVRNQGQGQGAGRVSFEPVRFGGIGIVTEASDEHLFEAIHRVKYRALLLLIVFTSMALMVGMLFSDTWTGPIRTLAEGVRKIGEGDFAVRLRSPAARELHELSEAFNTMAHGLAERERIEGVFRKFHHSAIAEHLLSGEMRLGGEEKDVVIFFCDLRGFTALTHGREPTWVLRILNEFLGPMVRVIERNHGVVDKYIGDSIMALWGVPISGGDDAGRALNAALEMRGELQRLNDRWSGSDGIRIEMGIGIHLGPVIAGNIGTEGKMEYTVVGESVNIASRVEGMNKILQTDILVTRSVAERVGSRFELTGCPLVRAKGLDQPLEVFEVKGLLSGYTPGTSKDGMKRGEAA